jgi:hypothetical protein
MNPSGRIDQQTYLALYQKTDMSAVKAFVAKHGLKAWHAVVKTQGMNLAKDATTQGVTTGLGLNFVDLRAPSYMLDPQFTHIFNTMPRWSKVNAGYGVQPTWKAVTSIDATNTFPGISEGNINAYSSFTEKDYSAPYVSFGTDDFVTYEGISASEGYEDALGDAKMWQLLRMRRMLERTYLGGVASVGGSGTPLALGTTATPTGALTALGGTPTALLPTGSYASAYCVALAYRAVVASNNTLAAGIVTQYGRVSADGSATDTINGGTAIISATFSNVVGPTTSPLPNILFQVAPKAGAWGYAWFVETNTSSSFSPEAASSYLTATNAAGQFFSSASAFVYNGQAKGTQTAAYAGTGGYYGFAHDNSVNALDTDGLLTIASNSNYTTGLPTASYPAGTGVTVLAGGADLHGAGLTNGGSVGTITEIDRLLFALQTATLTSPTAIYLSTDLVGCFRSAFLVGATGSPQANFFFPNGARAEDGLAINTHIADYCNVFATNGQAFIPVMQHPYLPAGTVLLDCANLGEQYSNSRMGETRGVFVRRDLYGIEFAQNTRKYPFGVFSEEVFAHKAPNTIGYLKSVGAFGTAALF